ncbi:heterokaryon incompatibility protein-domain-containing protein [Phaeosphaeriaceae sp. PMI808]|nr:heterokaryon incompatibility protein-domain-containing protein [Phaeosphaeriaceae sp. PMI808]
MTSLYSHTYEYTKFAHIDSIRLVELLPGPRDSPLACNIIEVRKSEKPVYEALSYAWGDPIFPHRLEEALSKSHVAITSNLHTALHFIRHENKARILWIDAVCINQDDLKEKGHQVKLMGCIFRDARRVVVWLGRHRGAKMRVLHLLNDLVAGFNQWKLGQRQSPAIRAILRLIAIQLFEQAWYTRVWVVQEFCLAQDIELVAAEDRIPMELLHLAVIALRDLCEDRALKENLGASYQWLLPLATRTSQLFDYRQRRLSSINKQLTCGNERLGISLASCVVELSRGRECKDERDRVYAVLALAEDDLGIQPDYTLSTENVMIDLATRSLLSGDLTVLHATGISPHHIAHLPSFVPSINGGATLPMNVHNLKFSAATDLPTKVDQKVAGILSIEGLHIDRIYGCANIYLTADSRKELYSIYDQFKIWMNGPETLRSLPPYQDLPLPELCAYMMTLGNRDFSRLESGSWLHSVMDLQGYLGIGPYWMQPDDEVVLFNGGATPFILRKVVTQKPDLGDRWQLVGDCVLIGWMNGDYFGHTIVDQIPLADRTDEGSSNSHTGKFLVRTEFLLV